MLTNAKRVALSATALISVWVLGAVALRVILGENYAGSRISNDIVMNLGLVLFFSISSGFAITYMVKNYIRPPIGTRNILLSIALIAGHCLLYSILFLRAPWTQVLLLVMIGMVCVTLVEAVIYLAVFRRVAEY